MLARELLAPFIVTRTALIAVAVLASVLVPYGRHWCEPRCDLSTVPLLNALSRWDGGEYLSVARDGYSFSPDRPSNVAFAPLLPMVMRAGASLAGRGDDDALIAVGLVAVNAALLGALAYLLALGRLEVGDAAARRAVVYLLVFPTAIFLSALYAESLFLFFGIGAALEARRRRWWRAGVLGALAAIARPFGVVLALPIAVEMLAGRPRRRDVAAAALPLVSFAAWQSWLSARFGDPFVYLAAQRSYLREVSGPVGTIADLAAYPFPWIIAACLILVTVLVAASWRVLRPSTAALATALFAVSLSSGTLMSFPRYALAIFPAFLVLGAFGAHRAVHISYLVAATITAVLLAAMYASWSWVA